MPQNGPMNKPPGMSLLEVVRFVYLNDLVIMVILLADAKSLSAARRSPTRCRPSGRCQSTFASLAPASAKYHA